MMALLAIVVSVPVMWWAWKYYQLPEFPDRRNYKTIEERAGRASDFAHRHNCMGLQNPSNYCFNIRYAWYG